MTPLLTLQQDTRFLVEAGAWLRQAGLMASPRFDAQACTLVEGDLQIDLLNVWHRTRQLTSPNTKAILELWVRPPTLAVACGFGREDVVRAAIAAGAPLDGGDPIECAVGAWVVTALHVRCVRLLFQAGAKVTRAQFDAHRAESMGRPVDHEMYGLLLDAAKDSPDPAMQAMWRADPRP